MTDLMKEFEKAFEYWLKEAPHGEGYDDKPDVYETAEWAASWAYDRGVEDAAKIADSIPEGCCGEYSDCSIAIAKSIRTTLKGKLK